jgi:hypothetical protein
MLSPETLSIAALQQLEGGRIDEAILRIYVLLKKSLNPHVNTVPLLLIRATSKMAISDLDFTKSFKREKLFIALFITFRT